MPPAFPRSRPQIGGLWAAEAKSTLSSYPFGRLSGQDLRPFQGAESESEPCCALLLGAIKGHLRKRMIQNTAWNRMVDAISAS